MDETPGKTLSSLTVAEKPRPKPGGCVGIFFQLFDWNRRFARKKLFSNRFLLGAKSKKASKMFGDDKLPMAKLLLIADENRGGFPDAKRSVSHDHCSSTGADHKHKSVRSPGIVGRLMGLDSMPARDSSRTNALEPHQVDIQRKLSESLDGHPCTEVRKKLVEYRPQKLQKTGILEGRLSVKSESFPFRTAVSRSRKHHHHHHQKLICPVKSSSSRYGRNGVRLMEAATRILEPGLLATSRSKCTLPCLTKPPTLAEGISTEEVNNTGFFSHECQNLKTSIGQKEALKFSSFYCDANVGDIRDSAETKLKPSVPSPDLEQGTTSKLLFGKPGIAKIEEWFPLDYHVKPNLQRMAGISQAMDRGKPCGGKEHDLGVPDRKPNCQKFEEKLIKVNTLPNVLNLHNEKENQVLTVKGGWHENARPCIKHSRRCSSCEASKESNVSSRDLNKPTQTRTYTKDVNQGNVTLKDREVKKRCSFDKGDDPFLRANALHRKKRPINSNSHAGTIGPAVHLNESKPKLSTPGCKSMSSKAQTLQNNINVQRRRHACPDHDVKREMDCNVNQTDGISFIFTSSMRPPSGNPFSDGGKIDKGEFVCGASNRLDDMRLGSHTNFLQKKRTSNMHGRRVPSRELKDVTGDSLSSLLEQKLRELTRSQGIELKKFPSKNHSVGESEARVEAQEKSAILILQDLLSALIAKQSTCYELQNNSSTALSDSDSLQIGYLAETECSSTSDGLINEAQSPQAATRSGVGKIKAFSVSPSESKNGDSSSARSEAKTKPSRFSFLNDSTHQSPVSIFDASFSNESCFSSESYDGWRGTQLHLSFSSCSLGKAEKSVVDTELIDSATSRNNSILGRGSRVDTHCPRMCSIDKDSIGTLMEDTCPTSEKPELDYITRILSSIKLSFDNVALSDVHHPCFADPCLFEKLESFMMDKNSKNTGCILDFMRPDGYHMRRFVFDFVLNYLALKFHRCSRGGYRALSKLPMFLSLERLRTEIFEEVSKHQRLQGRVLDEIVEWEMSTPLGKWTDFEIEAFEVAVGIEKCILQSLVTEVAFDLLQFM